ncbi:MAG: beta-N-acetylhexosaminidase [Phenylobacterium sp.]|uniref:beta-N-acetylhexosaminidase n=1 Tax=Phenylobacterium sp. TaxID=1871053 RepID=UPI00120E68CB|nr:beta-N-acetylhexosaminidase [Phenylobacterium sp.]TAL32130.1 MAG: beta-N-acetylhexosaminidase [Phenylobacterium sp.]
MSSGACILGCSGPVLTSPERALFAEVRPWGFILFARNVESPGQLRTLTASLRETVGRTDAPILIDQEGGRVQRLGPPHWGRYPPGRDYGALKGVDPLYRREIARLGGRLLAHDLATVGINVDCLPVLDVPTPGAHQVIGDRAYGDEPDEVALLGRAMAEGLLAGGVLPVIKHIPGHGRAQADSHLDLPVIEAGWEELDARDFAPFRALSDMPLAMTAHVIYAAIDRKRPATTSGSVMRTAVRGAIGFSGLVMSDDLSMKALQGGFRERAADARAAGCDVVLHCNGDLAEMAAVAEGAGRLRGLPARRAQAALARRPKAVEPFDAAAGRARFDSAFEGRFAA